MTRSRKLTVGGVVLGVGAVVTYIATVNGAATTIDPSRLAAVEQGTMTRSVVATGKIEPIAKVEIKSKANGIHPTELVDTFGSDAYRYYFTRALTFGSDGSISWEDIAARYTAELANGFGNLASRVIAMLAKYFDGAVPAAGVETDAEARIRSTVEAAAANAEAAIARFADLIERVRARQMHDVNGRFSHLGDRDRAVHAFGFRHGRAR